MNTYRDFMFDEATLFQTVSFNIDYDFIAKLKKIIGMPIHATLIEEQSKGVREIFYIDALDIKVIDVYAGNSIAFHTLYIRKEFLIKIKELIDYAKFESCYGSSNDLESSLLYACGLIEQSANIELPSNFSELI